jgi:RNase P subunit RPR2
MSETFLGNESRIPPDEIVDRRKPPICPHCLTQMWLTEFKRTETDKGSREIRDYACKQCGFDASSEVMTPFGNRPETQP